MSKIGFHYFPDTNHFRNTDLKRWLPRLKELQAGWLTVQAPVERAIPENFIKEIRKADIEPVLHFDLGPDQLPAQDNLRLLFTTYARWGVSHVILFDRPNLRGKWGSMSWARSDLVERFLDLYVPLVEEVVQAGLTPIFPPLEPGGDYWDTMFLRAGLAGMQRRCSRPVMDSLVLSAYADANSHPLNWGVGGPERWPEAHPYFVPEGSEDHRGFRIVDWYLTLSETVLEKRLPIFMLGLQGNGGGKGDPRELNIARLLQGQALEEIEPLPEEVLGGSFWLLAADKDDPHAEAGWYAADGSPTPLVERYLGMYQEPTQKTVVGNRFDHYLLLPTYEWGIADWHLEVIRGFIKKHRPTVGFSLVEAGHAQRVTVLGGEEQFSEEDLARLRSDGSVVRRITGDGTKVAVQLAAI